MIRSALSFCLTVAMLTGLLVPVAQAQDRDVDIQLLAAADVSNSMHKEVGLLQRRGYADALRSQVLHDAVTYGYRGRIGFSYVEWGDAGRIDVVVPWTIIDSASSARAVAQRLDDAPMKSFLKTSISHMLSFGKSYFESSGFRGARVIDVSGNGPNNQGVNVGRMRDQLVADGITINGLPIMANITNPRGVFGTGFDLRDLDLYYADCVIGGPGAFVLPVLSEADLTEAIKMKLVLEIAGSARTVPIQFKAPESGTFPC